MVLFKGRCMLNNLRVLKVFEFPNHIFKLLKDLYGLKKAPRTWYERLSNFLLEKVFSKGKVDITLLIKISKNNLLIVQIYVDDIIFGGTNHCLCEEFSKLMQGEFEMSLMGELKFFLSLQIKQGEDEIFNNQAKYTRDILKKFGMDGAKAIKTLMSTTTKLCKDESRKLVDEK